MSDFSNTQRPTTLCRLKERTPKGSWRTVEKAEVRTDEELDRVMKRWIGCKNFTRYSAGTGRVQRGEYTITFPRLSVLRGYSMPPDDRFDVINIVTRLKKRGEEG